MYGANEAGEAVPQALRNSMLIGEMPRHAVALGLQGVTARAADQRGLGHIDDQAGCGKAAVTLLLP